MHDVCNHWKHKSYSSTRTKSKTQQNKELMTFALKWYYDQKIISFFSSDFESVFGTKNKKKPYVGIFTYFSFTIQIGSNWYIDTCRIGT